LNPLDLEIRPLRDDQVKHAQGLAKGVWQDVLEKETGLKLDYPLKPELVLRTYMSMDPGGSLAAWSEGRMVGAIYAHAWGSIGWIGPMEVDPSWQGRGVGNSLLHAAEVYLRGEGCEIIGLEAASERRGSISFYQSRGFTSVGEAPFFEKRLEGHQSIAPSVSPLEPEELPSWSKSITDLCHSISPGLDLTREVRGAMAIGRVLAAVDDSGSLNGMAVLQTEGSRDLGGHQLRLMLVDPAQRREGIGAALLSSCESFSHGAGAGRLFFTTTIDENLIELLVSRKYRILGTNVRLVKGKGEVRWWDGNIISWTG
jgi:GNAT superfamily N-acetyltransferase